MKTLKRNDSSENVMKTRSSEDGKCQTAINLKYAVNLIDKLGIKGGI